MISQTAPTCPDLDTLSSGLSDALEDHLRGCSGCRAARDLCDARAVACDHAEVCEIAELWLAMREDGVLDGPARAALDAHLATCPCCAGLDAGAAAAIRPALPTIDPAAYSLGPELARGGMGRIRAAHDRRIGRSVVVKELLAPSPTLSARFEREARVTARLQHPGIVPIYEIGAWPDGTPFYVMRRVVGRTLREALATAATLDARLALLPALISAAEAVAFAHHQGVVHRDLKPANIVVGAYGDTVVIDWGLAKQLDRQADPTAVSLDEIDPGLAPPEDPALTAAGDVLGTAAYMPPEQAAGAEVDQRADVYALGALLHHLLAGAPPYLGSSAEILAQLRDGAPTATSPDLQRAPPDLVSIARMAMARNPDERYHDAGALVAELRRFTAGQVVAAHRYSVGESMYLWMRRHVVLATALIAGVLIGGVAMVGVLTERDKALAERRRSDQLLATLRADAAVRQLGEGHTWRAALELVDALRLGADTPGVRRELAEVMRGIDAIPIHTPDRELLARDSDGHAAEAPAITGAAFSPDGRRLVVSTLDGFDIYATDDGRHLVSSMRPVGWADEWVTQGKPAARVRFTPDGRFLVDEEEAPARRAAVWDAATGKPIVARTLPPGRVFGTARSADGTLAELAPNGPNATIEALDLVHGTIVRPAPDSLTLVAPRELAPSCERSLALPGELAKAVASGECGRSLEGHLIATLIHSELVVTDAATGQRRQRIPVNGVGTPIFVDHDRRLVVRVGGSIRGAGGGEFPATGQIELFDIASGALVEEYVGDAVALSADRTRLAVQPAQRGVVVVPLDRGPALAQFDRAAHGLARTRAVDVDGTTALGELPDGSVRVFDLAHDRAWPLPPLQEPAGLSRDGSRLIATRADGTVVVVQIATGEVLGAIKPEAPVRAVALDRTGEIASVLDRDANAQQLVVYSGEIQHLTDVRVGAINHDLIFGCHRTGGRARYDLETDAENDADPTPPGCATDADDAELPPREWKTVVKTSTRTVSVDGSTISVDSPDGSMFVLTAPEPAPQVVATNDLIATGEATWTMDGAELQPRRRLAAPAREAWVTPDHERLVVIDAEGNVSQWDLHLETRSAEELAAQLRLRLGLQLLDGEIFSDASEEERHAWRDLTRGAESFRYYRFSGW